MKHPPIALHIATIALCLGLAGAPAGAHDDDLGRAPSVGSLEGTWRLVSPRLEPGHSEYKVVSAGRFTWYVIAGGRMVRGAEGRASQDGRTYRERIDSVISDEFAWMVGVDGRFTADLVGDRWRHHGAVEGGGRRIEVDEVWERVR